MLVSLFIVGAFIELLVTGHRKTWGLRSWLLPIAIILLGIWAGAASFTYSPIIAMLLGVVSFYRLFNLLRIARGRSHFFHLRHGGQRTSITLLATQVFIYTIVLLEITLEPQAVFAEIIALQFVAGLILLAITSWNLHKTAHHPLDQHYADKELPTLTVAVPARNETQDLASCLESIVMNDYPKLEVLVLDDCSQDRTSEIIRDFAHDGVRFIQGDVPKEGWLAKNQAYEKLLQEATGEIVLFCGVDVRFGAGAIRSLVDTMQNKNRNMMSVMPFRVGGGVRTAFIQPMRYWWELVLPRRLFNRPPVLSTCWLIRRKTMKKLGGLSAVSQAIIPEGFFARELVKRDAYSFMRAGAELDIRTVKGVEEQLATAIRTRYPQLKRRPENVLLLLAVLTTFVVIPIAYLLSGFYIGFSAIHWLALLGLALYISVHYLILSVSNPANSVIALFNFPVVVLTELVLSHVSMIRYEFGEVEWKGRNVCIPVMEVIPKLPKSS